MLFAVVFPDHADHDVIGMMLCFNGQASAIGIAAHWLINQIQHQGRLATALVHLCLRPRKKAQLGLWHVVAVPKSKDIRGGLANQSQVVVDLHAQWSQTDSPIAFQLTMTLQLSSVRPLCFAKRHILYADRNTLHRCSFQQLDMLIPWISLVLLLGLTLMRLCSSRLAAKCSFMKFVLGFAPVQAYTTSASTLVPFSVACVPSADFTTRSFSMTCTMPAISVRQLAQTAMYHGLPSKCDSMPHPCWLHQLHVKLCMHGPWRWRSNQSSTAME